ncbi:MAG: replication-associated recombination protein A [Nitrospirae bacterium]|nr:replication-associated recombination protein A [Nitrospirota bacterium]
MQPNDLRDIVGQGHLLDEGRTLRNLIESDSIVSIIFFGPPGTGKTALAQIIAKKTTAKFLQLNAVTSGIKDIRDAVSLARSQRTILFIDEIHRFNKIQQDALLPHIENGEIILIGASTENPFFALIPALSSRTIIFKFNHLTDIDIISVLNRAVSAPIGLGGEVSITNDALDFIAQKAGGDARKALNILELTYLNIKDTNKHEIDTEIIKNTIIDKTIYYDKNEHYDIISAFIKSMRGSDPDASVYWLARMISAGEDPLFIARRIVICASEDVGNADPSALNVAVSAYISVEKIGMPEGRIPLSQAAIYVASAPKSNSSYLAIDSAIDAVNNQPLQLVPEHLRGSNYSGAKILGVSGYLYPHDYPNHYVDQAYLNNKIQFYYPTKEGFEQVISQRLEYRRQKTDG